MTPADKATWQHALAKFPRVELAHTPTPLEHLGNVSARFARHELYVKRDDCTGLGMGGNKARQLEFYLGQALAEGRDTVLSTGAVQSNYMRMLAAAAAKLGLECHLQLEQRVANASADYRCSGNVFLDGLFGAQVHRYRCGEDEAGADHALSARAKTLAARGKKPYIIPLGAGHAPLGALGYVRAALEIHQQTAARGLSLDLLAVGSGSGLTHAGVLTGLRLLGSNLPVLGICVRRAAPLQGPRVFAHCQKLAHMLGQPGAVAADDIWVDDSALAPGYGQASAPVIRDMHWLARTEGLLTDPVYTGKIFSTLFSLIRTGSMRNFRRIAILHSGGTPALFAYREIF